MNEHTAAQVLALEAFETTGRDGPLWTAQDRDWASRVARDSGALEGPAFIAERARVAWQRLGPRDPALARVLAARTRPWAWWAALGGLALGLAADAIGTSQRINLLAPPFWGLVAWNLAVYALLAFSALRGHAAGRVRSRLAAWLAPHLNRAGAADVRASFAGLWQRAAAPLWQLRATTALHVGAAALAAGLLAGLYLRGLVFDYRAGWASTFLGADTVNNLLATLLAPAAWASGVAVPDALRLQGAVPATGSAAPWIHLLAVTLLLAVIAPRLLLASVSAWRARRLREQFPLDLARPYYQALARAARPQPGHFRIWPHGAVPDAAAVLALRAALASNYGDAVQVQFAPACAAGAEDDYHAARGSPDEAHLAWVDMNATPEADAQGRWIKQLSPLTPSAPQALWVQADEFMRRFAHLPQRVAQRRAAWAAFAAAHGLACIFSDQDPATALRHGSNV